MKNNFCQFKDIKQFQKKSYWKTICISNIRFVILFLVFIGNSFHLRAQKGYTISVPTTRFSSIAPIGSTDALDIQFLIDEFTKYANIYKKHNCMKTLDPQISSHLKSEMKKIREGTAYLLTVDYENCKFVSLLPDKGTGGISSPSHTTYRIMLFEDITMHKDFPSLATINEDETATSKKPILATYKDNNGKWIAMGPYLTTDPYETENKALGSLFYADADLTFLCQRGKFNIYLLNGKVEHQARDIRLALKMLGINDIPE